ncbi:MAG: hypothetical protein CFE21_22010 [Bacteroidetes bacterium B1(2017)]|nr:MAG: hypothetical protein CFE21_22010 [Bacteroidetes bacterium B1(2017)]
MKILQGIVIFCIINVPYQSFAQEIPAWKNIPKIYQIGVGTEGLALGINFITKSPWEIISRVQYIGYHKTLKANLDNDTYVEIQPKIKRMTVQLGTARMIYKRWLGAEAGLSFLVNQQNKFSLRSPTGIDFEGLQIKAEDFGTVNVALKWSPVQPYAKLWIGGFSSKHPWSINTYVGCTYMGRPRFETSYDGFWETTNLSSDIKTIEKNMRNYSFYPMLGVVYALKK